MSEPLADPKGPPEPPEKDGHAPAPPAAADAAPAGQPLVGNGEPSDDAPTIISRRPHQPARLEEAFTATLRGRRLAHFELIQPIGVGGMAAVIEARDTQLERTVALKILPPEMASDGEVVRRFQQEARAAAKLDHENIARVFFCGEDQGLYFIAFEFVEGENLRTLLEKRGRIPVSEAIHYMLQIATGLAHAAARGVVHRDIKPSNIIISPNGRAKLVDMGLARSLEPHTDKALTQSGVTLGTFDYISPEQALEPREADFRSDIYSFGCTFYHMLTGQAPVPEGTAAKKLHHHQHVPPIDPRQLNPDIPDEVAAVLARTMAKDPKDRYQQPELLVQHLFQLAQKLGAVDQVPSGVFFVDAPLPNPPRMQLAFVGVVAAVFLVLIVALHGMSFRPPAEPVLPAPETSHGSPQAQGDIRPPPPEEKTPRAEGTPPPTTTPVRNTLRTADSVERLADVLKQKPARVLLAANQFDLTDFQGGDSGAVGAEADGSPIGIQFDRDTRELVLEGPADGPRPVVRLAFKIDRWHNEKAGAALTVPGGKVTLRNLRFEVDAGASEDITMSALRVLGGRCVLENCEFVQSNAPPGGKGWLTAFVARGPDASLTVKDCCFMSRDSKPGAQEVIRLENGASAELANCAFGPHAALVRVLGGAETQVRLSQCSAFLAGSSVFQIDDGTLCRATVEHCLFARPDDVTRNAILVQEGQPAALRFTGTDNRYYNLSGFLARSGPGDNVVVRCSTYEEFQETLREANPQGRDDKSRVLSADPWKNKNALALLQDVKPAEAFQTDWEGFPELRQDGNSKLLVGVQHCSWGPAYPALPPAVVERIVDPNADESGRGVYKTLAAALGDAENKDIILIKEGKDSRLVAFDPVRPPNGALELTIRPYRGHHPILSLSEGTRDQDVALFRVQDTRVQWENLEFLVRPQNPGYRGQAVAMLTGSGGCSFKNCVITLDAPADSAGVALAAVVLSDPKEAMNMKMENMAPADPPRVRFENCFVRGSGDLIVERASRPLAADAVSSLMALSGSLLKVEQTSKDMPGGNVVQFSLANVTAYLTGNLARLQSGKNGKDVLPTRLNPTNCLFISAGGQALVHVDGDVSDEAQLKRLFTWEPKNNGYVNLSRMLDQTPSGDDMAPPGYDQDRWVQLTGDNGQWRPKAATSLRENQPLAESLPAQYKLKEDGDLPPNCGTELSNLPTPHSIGKNDHQAAGQ